MKMEYTNLFRFAVNPTANEVQIIFEQAQAVLERGEDGSIKIKGATSEEVCALVMSASCARNLVREINKLLPSITEGE